jgi:hypothetical protein
MKMLPHEAQQTSEDPRRLAIAEGVEEINANLGTFKEREGFSVTDRDAVLKTSTA